MQLHIRHVPYVDVSPFVRHFGTFPKAEYARFVGKEIVDFLYVIVDTKMW